MTMVLEEEKSKRKLGGWKSVYYILANETFEKLASMSLMANLVLYLRTMYNMDNVAAVNVVIIWGGSSNLLPMVGAFLADAYLGKFKIILYGTVASLMGMGIMTLTAGIPSMRPAQCPHNAIECNHPPTAWHLSILFTALGLVSIGAGGIRPCNISFGADQFDTTTEEGRNEIGSFINWYFFFFTVAIIFTVTIVTYVQTNINWFVGFLIPTACFAISIAIFLLGVHTYVLVKPQGSIYGKTLKVFAAAFRKRRVSSKPFHDRPVPAGEKRLARTARFSFLDKAAMVVDPAEVDEAEQSVNTWRLCTTQNVEHLKCILNSFPILLVGVVCFISMNQPSTFGILQVLQMDRPVFNGKPIPPAWIKLTVMMTVSLWVLFYEKVYIPMRKNNGRLSVKQRFYLGILMSIISMIVAGVVEKLRRESALRAKSYVAPMSVFYLMIPFALSGLVEAFAAVSMMEHFTAEWPERMRTMAGAVFFLSLSLSSYLNSGILAVIRRATGTKARMGSWWLSGNDFNKNRLDYYYYVLAGVGFLNLVYFHFFANKFLENRVVEEHFTDDDDDRSAFVLKEIM